MQLGLKEGSETVDLPREPATLTFTILKHSLVVNSKSELEMESLDFFTMWKKGMLLTFGGTPGKFARWKWARISVLKYSSIYQYPWCFVLNSLYFTSICQVDDCLISGSRLYLTNLATLHWSRGFVWVDSQNSFFFSGDSEATKSTHHLRGCLEKILVQGQVIDLDRALYKHTAVSSHSCPTEAMNELT